MRSAGLECKFAHAEPEVESVQLIVRSVQHPADLGRGDVLLEEINQVGVSCLPVGSQVRGSIGKLEADEMRLWQGCLPAR